GVIALVSNFRARVIASPFLSTDQDLMSAHDLSSFCCQNPHCPDYGRRGTNRLTVCGHYGKQQRRLLYCKTCKQRFSETKGTPFFNSRLPREKAVSVLAHINEGCGVRKTTLRAHPHRQSGGF